MGQLVDNYLVDMNLTNDIFLACTCCTVSAAPEKLTYWLPFKLVLQNNFYCHLLGSSSKISTFEALWFSIASTMLSRVLNQPSFCTLFCNSGTFDYWANRTKSGSYTYELAFSTTVVTKLASSITCFSVANRYLLGHLYERVLKAIPLQAWIGPEGSRRLRLPDFKTIGT